MSPAHLIITMTLSLMQLPCAAVESQGHLVLVSHYSRPLATLPSGHSQLKGQSKPYPAAGLLVWGNDSSR